MIQSIDAVGGQEGERILWPELSEAVWRRTRLDPGVRRGGAREEIGVRSEAHEQRSCRVAWSSGGTQGPLGIG